MRYLGIARRNESRLALPDDFRPTQETEDYEAIEIGGYILLLSAPLNPERLRRIEELAQRSIAEHRKTLEGLAR